jgi:hypothetical protein
MLLVKRPINLAKRRQDASMMAFCGEQVCCYSAGSLTAISVPNRRCF